MAVSSANRTGLPAATSARAAEEMLGGSVAVYLDDGDRDISAPSTIVDCTVTPFRVVRQGALPFAELAAVVPDLLGPEPDSAGEEGQSGPAVPSGR
jgi:L-threonylcarbamoyladenylate synthase